MSMRVISLGKGYHASQEIFAAEDTFAKFILEGIVPFGESSFDVAAVSAGGIFSSHRCSPVGVQLVVGNPRNLLALACIASKATVRPSFGVRSQWSRS